MDFFEKEEKGTDTTFLPLAVRMRPRKLDEFVGQGHILGEGKLLRRSIEARILGSLIFYGPPGCGRTALAYIISAELTDQKFSFRTMSGAEPKGIAGSGLIDIISSLLDDGVHKADGGDSSDDTTP